MSSLALDDALWALAALAVDPRGLKGIWLRAPLGPVREDWLLGLKALRRDVIKIPSNIDAERLLGGLDLAKTLQLGHPVKQQGVLAQTKGHILICPMAERLPPESASILTQVLDTGLVHAHFGHDTQDTHFGLVAIDESLPEEPTLAVGLAEQLAIWLDLTTINPKDQPSLETLDLLERVERTLQIDSRAYQADIQRFSLLDTELRDICELAMGFAIESLRAPWYAARLASVFAVLRGAQAVSAEDMGRAARVVLTPRAKGMPAPSEPQSAPEDASTNPPPEQAEPPKAQSANEPDLIEADSDSDSDSDAGPQLSEAPPPDRADQTDPPDPSNPQVQSLESTILESALATLPLGLLNQLAQGQRLAKKSASGRMGQVQKGAQKGRPLPPMKGLPQNGKRLHVLATLRHAAPRQKIRESTTSSGATSTAKTGPGVKRLQIRVEDFHIQRFAQKSESCIIFCIDASGSAALERLAEAKGAVELLLKDSYARRDHICVISFRDKSAQLQLPATRSLVRAKRELQSLPGGGGTPLASAIKLALETSLQARQRGMTPTVVVLSDGRANVTLDGVGSRPIAKAQSLSWAQQCKASALQSIWLDTSARPDPQGQDIARAMGANYVPLPLANSQRMASTVKTLQEIQA
jgi:magnesium chelatase subunit D